MWAQDWLTVIHPQIIVWCEHCPCMLYLKGIMDNLKINYWNKSGGCYTRADEIFIPHRHLFKDDIYFLVRFHELIHATGHESRIDRFRFFSAEVEEGIAEVGAALLTQAYGLGAIYKSTDLPWAQEEIEQEAQNAIEYLWEYSGEDFILGENNCGKKNYRRYD